ncbi:MAG: prenyltransferase/squalene oxidase repeat-containing protein [Pirellulaceae bacterium]
MQSPPAFQRRVRDAHETVRRALLAERCDKGHWIGELSSSALATATALSALAQYRQNSRSPVLSRERIDEMIDKGTRWLLARQRDDGGWGDTDQSHSNVATTMLVVAALTMNHPDPDDDIQSVIFRANHYIDDLGRVEALRRRYGKDKTFAVPILANCAIAGIVPWQEVPALPCEAVLVPQPCYRFVHLPVVSYAIPALVAIGQAKFICDPPRNPLTRITRKMSMRRGMKVLEKMHPTSGGFLEAIPLTCFVAMSLAHTGRADHTVTHQCLRFVDESFRDEGDTGTWPIDTDLATWNTTLAINALGTGDTDHLSADLLDWLLDCQYRTVHPFTGAAPGGWGWSDLSGAVPDADDTPGALLALRKWMDSPDVDDETKQRIRESARLGIDWLLGLQNRDKGWPTFCRGWGRLPFDRSGCDITAHVIRALVAWRNDLPDPRADRAIENGFGYLKQNRVEQSYWHPLWFGNQDHPAEENPVYGTVKVMLAWLDAGREDAGEVAAAVGWLLSVQNGDGGWGGGPSHESSEISSKSFSSLQETALAVEVIARLLATSRYSDDQFLQSALSRGGQWLVNAIEQGRYDEKWPIGFYFAKLWYYERLYPLVFSVSAMRGMAVALAAAETAIVTTDRPELTTL